VDCARGPAMWTLGFPSTDHGVNEGGNEIHVNVVKMTTGEVGPCVSNDATVFTASTTTTTRAANRTVPRGGVKGS